LWYSIFRCHGSPWAAHLTASWLPRIGHGAPPKPGVALVTARLPILSPERHRGNATLPPQPLFSEPSRRCFPVLLWCLGMLLIHLSSCRTKPSQALPRPRHRPPPPCQIQFTIELPPHRHPASSDCAQAREVAAPVRCEPRVFTVSILSLVSRRELRQVVHSTAASWASHALPWAAPGQVAPSIVAGPSRPPRAVYLGRTFGFGPLACFK
jgi:hypothetical protein